MTATTARQPGLGDLDRRLIAPMILGSILNPVNSSMIAVALIPIGVAFGASPSATAWLVSALYLTTATGQPVVGRLVDSYGPRRLFLAGSALVGVAGLIGALAPTLGFLIAARVLLGLGTCADYPAAMYLIRRESERTGLDSPAAVLTALSVATQTVAVIGPSLGGLLIGLGGWRTIFAVNIPLALLSLILGRLRLPRGGGSGGSPRAIDFAGIGLFTALLTALLLFLMNPHPDRLWLLLTPPARRPASPGASSAPRAVHRPAGLRRQLPAAADLSADAAGVHGVVRLSLRLHAVAGGRAGLYI